MEGDVLDVTSFIVSNANGTCYGHFDCPMVTDNCCDELRNISSELLCGHPDGTWLTLEQLYCFKVGSILAVYMIKYLIVLTCKSNRSGDGYVNNGFGCVKS